MTAQSAGAAGNLVRGTELALHESSILYFRRAVALETFSGGEDDEPDNELIRRMISGVSAKVLSSRENMRAALLEKFPDIRDSSIIGAGDIEMTRDKHTAFPGSVGGYVDWYIGPTRQLKTTSAVMASPVQLGERNGSFLYSVTLGGSQIDGLYHVTGVQNEETSEFCEIVSQTRFLQDGTKLDPTAPKITTIEEAGFSDYQILEVQFTSVTPVERFRVSGFHAPGIAEIQEWVNHCDQAPVGLDILVKGAVPSVVRFSAIIHLPPGDVSAEKDTLLKNAVAAHVNRIPFGGLLAVSGLSAVLHNHLPSGCYLSRPALLATTYLPDGQVRRNQ